MREVPSAASEREVCPLPSVGLDCTLGPTHALTDRTRTILRYILTSSKPSNLQQTYPLEGPSSPIFRFTT